MAETYLLDLSIFSCFLTTFGSNKSLISFLFRYLNENEFLFIYNFEGTGFKHYCCELYSPIVRTWVILEMAV